MKREFLEGLEVGSEAIEKIMMEHKKELQAEQSKVAAKDAELTAANETIKGLQSTIKKFDGVDVEKLQQDAKDWESKYNTDIQAEREKAELVKKEYTLKDALKEKGVSDPDYLIYKHGGVEKFAFDDKGAAIGLDDTIKPYRESIPSVFSEKPETGSLVHVDLGGASGGPQGSSDQSANAQFNSMLRGALGKS